MAKDAKDKPAFVCHARRHMSGAVYKTYDGMLAMALSEERTPSGEVVPYLDRHGKAIKKTERKPGDPPLIFKGAVLPTLCNHTNTSKTQVDEHIDQLLDGGWLIDPNPGKRVRRANGRLAAVEYIILEHEDFVANNVGACPPYKFQQRDDKEAGIERGQRLGEKNERPVDFDAEDPLGRVKLGFARIMGKLPGKDWKEIRENQKRRRK